MLADIIYITAGIAFFVVCILFARGCDTVFHSNDHERGMEDDLPKRID